MREWVMLAEQMAEQIELDIDRRRMREPIRRTGTARKVGPRANGAFRLRRALASALYRLSAMVAPPIGDDERARGQ
ncbi:MAG: hypothetical protein EA403_01295 [Spirochaetaceae bacterium]|nr:MAG: hypothetical protein EA403_01295 [Spirochaetaceae bacterium]